MSFLPGVFTKNWQLKLLAFAMAVLLWTVPRFEAQSSRVLEEVPVRVRLSDPNWALMGDPAPAAVSVTLSGSARDLIAIEVEGPPILVPIDEVLTADTTVILNRSWFRGSERDGVVVEDLRPGVVNLRFEPIEERRIPFSAPLTGQVPQGLSRTAPPAIVPREARVFGPASRFEGIDSLPLIPLDLSRLAGENSFLLEVDTADIDGLEILPMEATVSLLTESTVVREFPGMTLTLPRLEADPQLQSRPSAVTVLLTGAGSLLEGIEPEDIRVTIPMAMANLAPGEEIRAVVAVEGLPLWVESRVVPDWVTLRRPAGQ